MRRLEKQDLPGGNSRNILEWDEYHLPVLRGWMILLGVAVTIAIILGGLGVKMLVVEKIREDRLNRLGRVTMAERAGAEKELALVYDNFVTVEHWIRRLEASNTRIDMDDVLALFLSLLETHESYMQLRILGLDGKEVLRVEEKGGRIFTTADKDLQDKSDRDYFQVAKRLKNQGVFVSPVGLNSEHGEIETPLRPVFQLSSPLPDNEGVRWGYLVLNYSVDSLMKNIALSTNRSGEGSHLAVLNEQGYYLEHPRRDWLYGHELAHRESSNMARRFPDIWQVIQSSDEGALNTNEGLFAFAWADLPTGESAPESDLSMLSFLVLAHLPAEEVEALVAPARVRVLSITSFVWLLSMGLVWLLYRNRRQHYEYQLATRDFARRTYHVLQSICSGIIVSDAVTHRVQYANTAAATMLGAPSQSIVGRSVQDLVFLNESTEQMLQLLREGDIESVVHEGRLRRMDGQMAPIYYTASLIRENNEDLVVNSFIDFSEEQSHRERLRKEARTDALTGVGNRRFFIEQLERELERLRRHGGNLTMLSFDIDHFKRVNDTWGHEAGDCVLQEVAAIALDTLRRSDVLGRTGGEEFSALLVATDLEQAHEVAERLRLRIADMECRVDGQSISVTISIGLAEWHEGDNGMEVLKRADQKLYESKENGRNRVTA